MCRPGRHNPAVALTQNSRRAIWRRSGRQTISASHLADSANRLYVIDVATQKRVTVASDPFDLNLDHRWSPDGQFLAYSLNEDNSFSGIFIWSAADGSRTASRRNCSRRNRPAWAPNGELLYFLSQRDYAPIIGRPRRRISRPTGDSGFAQRAATPDVCRAAGCARHRRRDRFRRVEQRTIRVPVEADDISELYESARSLLYLRTGPIYSGTRIELTPTVMAYSIKDREATPVAEDVIAWSASADGKHVLAEADRRQLKYFEVGDER